MLRQTIGRVEEEEEGKPKFWAESNHCDTSSRDEKRAANIVNYNPMTQNVGGGGNYFYSDIRMVPKTQLID